MVFNMMYHKANNKNSILYRRLAMTDFQKQILEEIRMLEKELKKEIALYEKEMGKELILDYSDRKTEL